MKIKIFFPWNAYCPYYFRPFSLSPHIDRTWTALFSHFFRTLTALWRHLSRTFPTLNWTLAYRGLSGNCYMARWENMDWTGSKLLAEWTWMETKWSVDWIWDTFLIDFLIPFIVHFVSFEHHFFSSIKKKNANQCTSLSMSTFWVCH